VVGVLYFCKNDLTATRSVTYIEDKEKIFLKTIIPNSKATKKYWGGKK